SSRPAAPSGGRGRPRATSRRTAPAARASQPQPSCCSRCDNSPVIALRPDTVTQPTAAMRRAIGEAVVGDEQKREDPTVIELERRVAELLGHEDAVSLPTATMANHIALKLLSHRGDVLIAERHSHVVVYEYGGAAVHAGLM